MNATVKTDDVSLGKLIDNLYKLRAKRIEKQHEVDDLKKEEDENVKLIMMKMEESGLESVSGRTATFSTYETTVPKLVDYNALIGYIKDSGHIHLLGRRVSATAYRELYELEGGVPGVEPYTFSKHSLTRSKK